MVNGNLELQEYRRVPIFLVSIAFAQIIIGLVGVRKLELSKI